VDELFTATPRQRCLVHKQRNVLSAIHDHNINFIMSEHRQRMNKVKRAGARLRLWTCPPLALVLGCIAWGYFRQPGSLHVVMGMIYALGSLASLSMLVLGAIFDRLRK
jgi:hypothetical protein